MGLLSPEVLNEFFDSWQELASAMNRVRTSRGGSLIQLPKVPSAVSETIAAHLLKQLGKIPVGATLRRGGGADLLIVQEAGRIRIEVKGSGAAELQHFGPKDYACDFLVWLRFGDVTQLARETSLRYAIFPKPSECLGDLGTRVTFAVAIAAATGGEVQQGTARIGEVLAL